MSTNSLNINSQLIISLPCYDIHTNNDDNDVDNDDDNDDNNHDDDDRKRKNGILIFRKPVEALPVRKGAVNIHPGDMLPGVGGIPQVVQQDIVLVVLKGNPRAEIRLGRGEGHSVLRM